MSSNMKKWLSRITPLAIAFVFCLGGIGLLSSTVFANELETSDLIVDYDGNKVGFRYDKTGEKLYRVDDATVEVGFVNVPKYTAVKKTGSTGFSFNATGPEVSAILQAAGIDTAAVQSDTRITFTSGTKSSDFRWDELFNTPRYAFPNLTEFTDPENGGLEPTEKLLAVTDDDLVPVILNTAEKNGTLCFGQVSPTEQNKPAFVSSMLKPSADGIPTISVETGVEFQKVLTPVEGPNIQNLGDTVYQGAEIDFRIPESEDDETIDYFGTIYYTTNGNAPSMKSAMYNWDTYYGIGKWKLNPPVAKEVGTLTVKAQAFDYGMEPSEIVTFTYDVVPKDISANGELSLSAKKVALGKKPTVVVKVNNKAISSNFYTVSFANTANVGTGKVKVTAKAPFTGELSSTFDVTANLSANKGAIVLNKTTVPAGTKPAVSKVTILSGKQTLNKAYYTATVPSTSKVGKYSVTVKGKNLVTGTITKPFTVIPAKAAIKKLKKGKKKATVTIVNQAASGVTKYQVAYKKKSAKSWKTKTTTKTKVVIKKLKKGKKYNFKVRAYGPTGYGEYSTVKTVKVK